MKKISISGFLMFEVLLSIAIISLVFLSLLTYQIDMLKRSEQLNFNLIAMQQLFNFSEMLRIAQNNADQNQFFSQWNQDNQAMLPQGQGVFSQEGNYFCKISLSWVFQKKEIKSEEVLC